MRKGLGNSCPLSSALVNDRPDKGIECSLFPGYCFGRVESRKPLDVLQVPGTCCVVGRGIQSEGISDKGIEALRVPFNQAGIASCHGCMTQSGDAT